MRTLHIFISSPGDVGQERLLAQRVIERLSGEFAAFFKLECFLWENLAVKATSHFQDQIGDDLSQADIMICIIWQRLGTQLPGHYVKEDGTPYLSGTEWEFETAARLYRETGKPLFLVYRKTKKPDPVYLDEQDRQEREKQRRLVAEFWRTRFGDHIEGFKAAYTGFETAEEFEEKLEVHLRDVIKKQVPDVWTEDQEDAIRTSWFSGSPYRGLETFEEEHAPVFFGRTKAVTEIKDLLVRQAADGRPFLMIFGGSGSGKSSVVRAGVIPTLTHPGVIEGVDLWRRCIFRPGDAGGDPFRAMAQALNTAKGLPELFIDGKDPAQVAAEFGDDSVQAEKLLTQALEAAAAAMAKQEALAALPVAKLLVVIDQAEELFTAGPDAAGRRRFVQLAAQLAAAGLVWFLGTMRSDFYARCAEIPELVELKSGSGQYDLLPPSFSEIGQIILKPTYAAGLRFEKNVMTGQTLDEVLHEAAAANRSALPLLEFTLAELYKQRQGNILTFAAYHDMGGMEGALARNAERVFASLPPAVQAVFPDIFRAITTIDDHEDEKVSGRRVDLAVITISGEHKQYVDAFVQARLLVVGTGSDGAAAVGVAHESLLRSWPRVQAWLNEEKDFLRLRNRLLEATLRWQEENRRDEYLLPAGKPLNDARDALKRCPAHLDGPIVAFIEASLNLAKRRRRNRRLAAVAACVALIGGFYAFMGTTWGEKMVELRHDIETVMVGGVDILTAEKFGWVSDQLAFIDIDHETYLKWGKPELTPRDKLAELIEMLHRSGVKVIALDIFLDEADYQFPDRDARLRQVLQAIKNDPNGPKIIFPVKMYSDGMLGTNIFDDLIDNQDKFFKSVPWATVASNYDNKMRFWYPYDIYTRPDGSAATVWGTPLLAAALGGNAADQLHTLGRQIALAAGNGKNSNLYAVTMHFGNKEVKANFADKTRYENHRIKYYLVPEGVLRKDDPGNLFLKSFKVSGLGKYLSPRGDVPLLRGKIVVVGNSSPDKHDSYPTPLGTMPGMYVHGNVINSIILGL
ncbi:MAG TPA: CHASE2 domain-containing protein [Methylomusa anaerophila]|uniref:CHASE2 domain protein n=1 Tax=Methylomusa anaerophila TaxID=1930071 RepID=A0A348AJ69_9FIRM|nr:CHASE2 domain-containing protein [Methylomusa anaerophila]BBB91117.1 CHASE2 domain protein [Methylomusa anaerophila]HML88994.1 CHASE2 domain-containing protein [Methylomusa anaerophila]